MAPADAYSRRRSVPLANPSRSLDEREPFEAPAATSSVVTSGGGTVASDLVRMSNARLARVAVTCLAVFATAWVVAAVGYAEWMWVFVFAGLLFPPAVLVGAVGLALGNRLFRPRFARR